MHINVANNDFDLHWRSHCTEAFNAACVSVCMREFIVLSVLRRMLGV